jgi:hypothetical protein
MTSADAHADSPEWCASSASQTEDWCTNSAPAPRADTIRKSSRSEIKALNLKWVQNWVQSSVVRVTKGKQKAPRCGAFAVAGAGFEQTSTTAYRFAEVRPLPSPGPDLDEFLPSPPLPGDAPMPGGAY